MRSFRDGNLEMSTNQDWPTVSIVIPCYNAERWVEEAVESCLNQRYPNIEIIAVDDGSTDGSLGILQRYQPRIQVATGPNRGGNSARNTGFSRSTGKYIQFLDADDYLEPDKIGRQVEYLERTGADAVYGDLRSRRHLADSRFSYMDPIWVSGAQEDIIASLLSFWVVNGGAILYRREAVERVGGWDEKLRAVQDTDFLMSVALSEAKIVYQPGSHFVYRRYGALTVSTSSLKRWLDNMCNYLAKSEASLLSSGRLTTKYRSALAIGYFETARACYRFDGWSSFTTSSQTLNDIIDKILKLAPDFKGKNESRAFLAVQSLFGFRFAMHLFIRARGATHAMRSLLRRTFLFNLALRLRGITLEQESIRRAVES
ncbi:glycosyltransferase family 2 protein [Bradyrhizobium sp.]|uniref:glycosyltransferase family 2 protein n=1 Tax=Bradyrhizobium sp. TaxID=376 RepID=UPI0039E6F5F0